MTTLDDAIASARAADDEDFFADLLPEAARHVIECGHASTAMLGRRMRVGHALASDLLLELHEAGVVGPADQDGARPVLVDPGGLTKTLAELATLAGEDPPPDQPPSPVSLAKTSQPGDQPATPGGELEVRPDDDLAEYQPGEVEPPRRPVITAVVRVRQATARGTVWVVDQPAVARSLAVGKQLPGAGGKLVKSAPRGGKRVGGKLKGWLVGAESASLMAHHSEMREGDQYAKVQQARTEEHLGARRWWTAAIAGVVAMYGSALWAPRIFGGVLAVLVFAGLAFVVPRRQLGEFLSGLAVAALAGVLVWNFGPALAGLVPRTPPWPWWVWCTVGGLTVLVLGWLGRQEDKPLMEMPPKVVPHELLPITAPMVIGALVALGKSQMKEPESVRILMDPVKVGDGALLEFELPGSVTAADIIEDREALAAAMRYPLGCVWPSVGPRHPGNLMLFVSRSPMATAKQAAWPLADGSQVSVFDPLELFTDQCGQWVKQTLAYTSWVIGAVPRMGKTRSLLNIGLTCALDPRARLYVFDLKGTGDLSALAKVAHFYGVGDEPEDIEEMLLVLRSLRQEMRARARAVRALSLEENPDKGKVTDALATRDPKRFGPIVVEVDEVQVWTQEFSEALPSQVFDGKRPKDPGKETRDEFIAILRDLVKRGPALGIITILATQKPDAKSIPSSIADNASARLCFKVNGQISNDQILGTSSYQAGVRATQFAFSEKGIAYFRGDGAEPLVVRTVDMDASQAEEIAARARALRLAEGLLTGAADEIEDALLITDIVDDVEQVMRDRGRGTAHHQELVAWLRELREEEYESITVDELSARLRARGVKVTQLRIGGVNRKGVRISDLRERGNGEDA